MNDAIEELVQRIGQEAVAAADDLVGRLLVYAEADEGFILADLFYIISPIGSVRFKLCPDSLVSQIRSFWEECGKLPNSRYWRVMCYIIDGDRFNIDFIYDHQLREHEDEHDRRTRAVTKYFGEAWVDYPRKPQ